MASTIQLEVPPFQLWCFTLFSIASYFNLTLNFMFPDSQPK